MHLKNSLPICILFIFVVFTCHGQNTELLPVKVFILGGQSNMDGTGRSEDLPEEYQTHLNQIRMWDNKEKKWVDLGTDSFAKRRKFKFGPEIAFSHLLSRKFSHYTIALVKTSGGGTKLWKHWLPGQPMYTRFLSNLKNALQDFKDKEIPYEICGMLWMQGESDAETLDWASAYEKNLKMLFKDVRKQTDVKRLPIIMGRISIGLLRETPWNFDYTEVVQQAQNRVAAQDKNVYIINTDALTTLKDNTHFDSKAQLWLGKRMGELMLEAIK